ncbi:hypothetical protein SERLA73DRAFT_186547 [Serpula lacrymans var. lacrymans S7.3]|uniref:Cytidyltransferase-like domain-containing protein n=2 Tax=Serpula lacrymans var. lacrymans TaxID=341189 RepID=F8Q7G8_SERL3|nr:uncharacterized protein SERLADRAFT_475665 [Serpula lacrymans var. lacrymans S7.9]EGN95506.1 hypothetical protein SERLA73DRAFT_186547 [Serpula lacrymans var. lacrymans S7.3]EGO21033.1 hypothetical protein SERLADRAFT_475665 [Serpula lacrymans var. lacrymans S7.9]
MSPISSEGIKKSLLIATLPSLDAPHFLAPVIASAATVTSQRLVIVLLSPAFDLHRVVNRKETKDTEQALEISRTEKWDAVQRLLTFVYVQATKVAQDLGKVLMDIDVLLHDPKDTLPGHVADRVDVVFRVEGDNVFTVLPQTLSSVREQWIAPAEEVVTRPEIPASTTSLQPSYRVVALGGTFDHLHAGHKILLSMAAWIANEKVIVGVTDDVLLKNKANKHVLEDLSTRIERTRAFMKLFRSDLEYDFVPIRDVYGPTGWDANIQALVVSKETLSGAASIAKERASKSLPSLQTFVIDVISSKSEKLDHEDVELLKQAKMSSTFIREWIVKNQESDPAKRD